MHLQRSSETLFDLCHVTTTFGYSGMSYCARDMINSARRLAVIMLHVLLYESQIARDYSARGRII